MFGFPSVEGETTEIHIMRSNGGITTAEMRVVKVTWGEENAYLASLRDISERKQAEEKLTVSQQPSNMPQRVLSSPTKMG